jgi:peptidoglycan/xylan/chitin deacetylase (PgdA/CDA1 family)
MVIARDESFAVVVAGPGEDLGVLAQHYLGDRGKRWRIAEFNDIDEVRPGHTVVIPLKVTNPTGVHPGGYLTVPILCYHRFGPRPSQLAVTPAAFEAQMEYLARNGYHVIPLASLLGFLERGEPIPRKSVVLTIDDGYRSTYEVAFPILRKFGFQATVFLYSDFVGAPDALTWPQMKEMEASGLVDIQPHSKTHANLATRLLGETDAKYRERMRTEVDTPVRLIQERLAVPSLTFAFPYGDVNETVVDLLKRDGVRLGVTVTPGGNGFYAYPFMLRRSMVFGSDGIDVFRSKLATFAQATPR